jgi:hypothetical protein
VAAAPYTANYGCDCLRQVDLGTGSRGNPKDLPSQRARQPVERFLSGTSRPSRLAHTRPGVAADPLLGVAITGAGRRLEQGGFSRAPQYATPFAPGLSAGAFPRRHTRRGPSANTTDADLSLLVHAYAITPRTTSESCAMRPYERGTPAGRIRRLLASSHPRILLQVSFAAVQGDA